QREYAWKERALQQITAERVGAYRDTLSLEHIEDLERLGRHALPSLGYELSTDGQRALSVWFILKLSWALSRFVSRLPWHSVLHEVSSRPFSGWSLGPAGSLPFLRTPRKPSAGPSAKQPCSAVEAVGSDHASHWDIAAVCRVAGADGRRLSPCLE